MADSFYDIGGQEVPVADIPSPDRSFRDAWVWNGSVLTIDMPTAKKLKIDELTQRAVERKAELEREIVEKKVKGEDVGPAENALASLKGPPKQAGLAAIQNAASPQALKAIGLADLF